MVAVTSGTAGVTATDLDDFVVGGVFIDLSPGGAALFLE
jgi:hypothetical protein